MAGNFIADHITGSNLTVYPSGIALGIKMHRKIDAFTDQHEIVSETRKLLYPHFGKYALVVQDVFYDYFLANDWGKYHDTPLAKFTSDVYTTLANYSEYMNERGLRTLEYMSKQDWLYNYKFLEGIDRSMKGLSRRAKYKSNMENGLEVLLGYSSEISGHFNLFFPELVDYSRDIMIAG